MKIHAITVSAGRTFNHPHEQYANFRFDIQQSAMLEEGDDPEACLAHLTAQAEMKAEAHKRAVLEECHNLAKLASLKSRLESANRQNKEHEDRTADIAKYEAEIAALTSRPFLLGPVTKTSTDADGNRESEEWQ